MAQCRKCKAEAGVWRQECFDCERDRLLAGQAFKATAMCPDCSMMTRVMVSTEDGDLVWHCNGCNRRWRK